MSIFFTEDTSCWSVEAVLCRMSIQGGGERKKGIIKGARVVKLQENQRPPPPSAWLPELQKYRDTIGCSMQGVKVLGHNQQQLTQTLIVCFYLFEHVFLVA